jgi:hypothetical protein
MAASGRDLKLKTQVKKRIAKPTVHMLPSRIHRFSFLIVLNLRSPKLTSGSDLFIVDVLLRFAVS